MTTAEIDIDLGKIYDIEFDGIDWDDYPNFCDAFISGARINDGAPDDRRLTDGELEWVNEQSGWVHETLYDML